MLIAIVLGAFFKHSMKDLLTLEQIESFDTGIRYQMIHSLSLICLGFNSSKIKFHKMISNLFIIWIILFSFLLLAVLQDILDLKLLQLQMMGLE